jgi:hypothetical protein
MKLTSEAVCPLPHATSLELVGSLIIPSLTRMFGVCLDHGRDRAHRPTLCALKLSKQAGHSPAYKSAHEVALRIFLRGGNPKHRSFLVHAAACKIALLQQMSPTARGSARGQGQKRTLQQAGAHATKQLQQHRKAKRPPPNTDTGNPSAIAYEHETLTKAHKKTQPEPPQLEGEATASPNMKWRP